MSGRLAGVLNGPRTVQLGFAICAAAALFNVGYNLLADAPQLPWAVLPMVFSAFGIALAFPVLTLALLDMYPRQRGAVSSLQSVLGLSVNATMAGLVSPLVSADARLLALVAAASVAVGWLIWLREAAQGRPPRAPSVDEAVGLEPREL
jgi:DHA1 family bicyclomycin/chloramphenicol resistance-like MFS transporter